MSGGWKYMLGTIPAVLFIKHWYNSKSKPFEMTIRGNNRMIVSFKHNFGIKLTSIHHTYNENKLDSSYSHICDDLIIEKHTVNDAFSNNFPIMSVVLADKKKKNNYDEIVKLIKSSSIKTHIIYSTLFTQNNELILEWSTDANYVYDDKF